MRNWKAFLKGAWDGRADGQAMLVTGSARMDTFQQRGESLAGRYFGWRLHPFSVRELVQARALDAAQALQRLLQRGGFPEPCLAEADTDAERWRAQYVTDLVREDVIDFSRVHAVRTLQLLLEMLRERVGSPLKLSGLAQALQMSPATAARYIEILEALYIAFRVAPWHRDVARSLLREPTRRRTAAAGAAWAGGGGAARSVVGGFGGVKAHDRSLSRDNGPLCQGQTTPRHGLIA